MYRPVAAGRSPRRCVTDMLPGGLQYRMTLGETVMLLDDAEGIVLVSDSVGCDRENEAVVVSFVGDKDADFSSDIEPAVIFRDTLGEEEFVAE